MKSYRISTVAALTASALGLMAAPALAASPLTVIGHRGMETTQSATENGKYAVKAALQAGAEGIEVDVRQTKDGKLVVMHDPTLDRTTTCTGEVTKLTYDQVRACQLKGGKEKVPNVYDIAWTFSKYDSKGDKLWLHVKFKPTSKARKALFKAVDKYKLRKQVVILADEDEMLDAFRKWSGIERALIFNQADVNQGGREAWEGGFDYAVPYRVSVTPELVALARSKGSKVFAVENNPVTLAQAKALGLDGLVANDVVGALAPVKEGVA